MRINEDSFAEDVLYSSEMEERVIEIFLDAVQIVEEKRIFSEIKKESAKLRNLFWTEEEQKEKKEAVSFFDARMQAMVFYTLRNLEGYQKSGWKELINEGENRDGTDGSISKNQD